jgi:hypothetical protein
MLLRYSDSRIDQAHPQVSPVRPRIVTRTGDETRRLLRPLLVPGTPARVGILARPTPGALGMLPCLIRPNCPVNGLVIPNPS